MRTDTERLDWLEKTQGESRKRIDAAMDAEEARELEEAWRWFGKHPHWNLSRMECLHGM